jgi:hypothetical protein
MTLAEKLMKTREQNKDLFHPFTSSFLSQQTKTDKEPELAVPDTKELDKILGFKKMEKTRGGEEDFATELAKLRGDVVVKKGSESDSIKSELAKLRDPTSTQHKNSVKEMLTGDAF